MNWYTKHQYKRIHNRTNLQWTTDEKILEYKGLITIFDRERRREINEANKLRRQQAKHLKDLRNDCQYFRSFFANCTYGNKQRLRNALSNSSILLVFQNRSGSEALEYIERDNHMKQRKLDCMTQRNTQRMKYYEKLLLERSTLQDRFEIKRTRVKFIQTLQILHNKIQVFVVRQNAAAEINKIYKNMLQLLRNDAYYYDAILKLFHTESEEQCRGVVRATEVGQLASEDVIDIQNQHKRIEKEVRRNMKEREREVRIKKKTAELLFHQCQLMTRGQNSPSSPLLSVFQQREDSEDYKVMDQYEIRKDELEQIIKRMQEATTTSRYLDVFPMVVIQVQQEEMLCNQIKKLTTLRNRVLAMKHQAQLVIFNLEYYVTDSQRRFLKAEQDMQNLLDDESQRLESETEAVEECGVMMTTVKRALQALFETINKAKEKTVTVGKEVSSVSLIVSDDDMTPSEIEKTFPPRIEQDATQLVVDIGERLLNLLHRSQNIILKDEPLRLAKVERERYSVARNHTFQVKEEGEYQSLVDEQEREDIAVLSRVDVKGRSKSLVEREERYIALAKQGLGPYASNFKKRR